MLIFLLFFLEVFFFVLVIRMLIQIREKKICENVLDAKIVEYYEVPGKPKRYIVDVIFEYEKKEVQGRLISYDKNAKSLSKLGNTSIVYVKRKKKVYWAEESIKADYVYLAVLIIIMIGVAFVSVATILLSLLV